MISVKAPEGVSNSSRGREPGRRASRRGRPRRRPALRRVGRRGEASSVPLLIRSDQRRDRQRSCAALCIELEQHNLPGSSFCIVPAGCFFCAQRACIHPHHPAARRGGGPLWAPGPGRPFLTAPSARPGPFRGRSVPQPQGNRRGNAPARPPPRSSTPLPPPPTAAARPNGGLRRRAAAGGGFLPRARGAVLTRACKKQGRAARRSLPPLACAGGPASTTPPLVRLPRARLLQTPAPARLGRRRRQRPEPAKARGAARRPMPRPVGPGPGPCLWDPAIFDQQSHLRPTVRPCLLGEGHVAAIITFIGQKECKHALPRSQRRIPNTTPDPPHSRLLYLPLSLDPQALWGRSPGSRACPGRHSSR